MGSIQPLDVDRPFGEPHVDSTYVGRHIVCQLRGLGYGCIYSSKRVEREGLVSRVYCILDVLCKPKICRCFPPKKLQTTVTWFNPMIKKL